MIIQLFNEFYFFFILLGAGIILGLYFLLKNKSIKTKKIVLVSLLFLNLALHFSKIFYEPYLSDPNRLMRDLWFINICGASVFFFPFIFLSKSNAWKDFMFYLGILSGFLALVFPTEAFGDNVLTLDLWRFYFCHIIIIAVPLLMVILKVHTLDYKRIWKMPFIMMVYLLFIMCNQILQSELGIVALRGSNITDVVYTNTSFIWGPTDPLAVVFTIFTPEFMTTIPWGEFAGEPKYWPFFYLLPAVFIYFITLPFFMCLPWQFKKIKADLIALKRKIFYKKKCS